MRVLPDVSGIDRCFDYLVPDELGDQVRVGTVVRISLHGRRVGGWVVADHVAPPPGVRLLALAKVTGWGPPPDLVELSAWAAWRWAGRRAALLGAATHERAVPTLAPSGAPPPVAGGPLDGLAAEVAHRIGREPVCVVRLPPASDPYAVVQAVCRRGPTLVLAPGVRQAAHLGLRLRRAGATVAVLPRDWPRARAGGAHVVGSRAAAWAPVDPLSGVVVLDEHDESYQEERAPTWHARDVALERARRAGVPCVLVSAVPTLEALAAGVLLTASRAEERAGWPVVDVVDRSQDDPVRGGLLSERLGPLLRGERRVVCVLNRTGRSRLSACDRCGRVARCETCQAAVVHTADGSLACLRCATRRPLVCDHCGSTVLRNLRAGVTRVREELEALARRPVVEVTAATAGTSLPDAGVYVGTEAVLHQVDRADVVVFLDLDQELLAPRYRAAEQALGLLARAARLLGGRDRGARGGGEPGRLVLQTRLPNHEVVQAALHADPARVAAAEHERRSLLRFPPAAALASVSGAAAGDYVAALGRPLGVEVLGPDDGHWLVRATDHRTLCDTLAATPRPAGRLRVEVDPLRI
ncbi:MAG: hypothetical protein MUF83_05985 [Acidimicrobiales bacterium]|nr:hypothetical protein [Acidimicrobiales bacterium]